jgi:hypothetical protein
METFLKTPVSHGPKQTVRSHTPPTPPDRQDDQTNKNNGYSVCLNICITVLCIVILCFTLILCKVIWAVHHFVSCFVTCFAHTVICLRVDGKLTNCETDDRLIISKTLKNPIPRKLQIGTFFTFILMVSGCVRPGLYGFCE